MATVNRLSNNAIATQPTAQTGAVLFQWTREQIDTIKNTVARGATDSDLYMFLHRCSEYRLDPFLREMYCLKMNGSNGPVTIFTSHDGYLKIANRDPNFDGLVADVVYKGDSFRCVNGVVQHVSGNSTKDKASIIGAYAQVYRKDRKIPAYFYAPFSNYNKPNHQTWQQYPHAMILKVAENMAIKRAFALSGLVSQEEIDDGALISNSTPPRAMETPTVEYGKDAEVIDLQDSQFEQRKKRILQMYITKCGTREAAIEAFYDVTGKKPYKDWTLEDVEKLEMMPNFDSTPEMPIDVEVESQEGAANDEPNA